MVPNHANNVIAGFSYLSFRACEQRDQQVCRKHTRLVPIAQRDYPVAKIICMDDLLLEGFAEVHVFHLIVAVNRFHLVSV